MGGRVAGSEEKARGRLGKCSNICNLRGTVPPYTFQALCKNVARVIVFVYILQKKNILLITRKSPRLVQLAKHLAHALKMVSSSLPGGWSF